MDDFRGLRRDAAHELRVEQVALRDGIRDQSLFGGVIAQQIQACQKVVVRRLLFIALELQLRKQAIPRECFIQRMQQLTVPRRARPAGRNFSRNPAANRAPHTQLPVS